MRKTEPTVFMNMCMICSGGKVLVQERKKQDWPGIAFPGGHVEPGESLVRSVILHGSSHPGGLGRDGSDHICAPVMRHQGLSGRTGAVCGSAVHGGSF